MQNVIGPIYIGYVSLLFTLSWPVCSTDAKILSVASKLQASNCNAYRCDTGIA